MRLKNLYLSTYLPDLYAGPAGPTTDLVAVYTRSLAVALLEGGVKALSVVPAKTKEKDVDWEKEQAVVVGRKYVIYDRWGFSVGATLDNVGWEETFKYFGFNLVREPAYYACVTLPKTRFVKITKAEHAVLSAGRKKSAGSRDLIEKLKTREWPVPVDDVIYVSP